jgi:hypothetical protein
MSDYSPTTDRRDSFVSEDLDDPEETTEIVDTQGDQKTRKHIKQRLTIEPSLTALPIQRKVSSYRTEHLQVQPRNMLEIVVQP